ncbi:GNAT family N-acetyltransferase [Halobacillus fulvus]|nr:GNAT family N-acetyltransferase [Halobacillus fulvus]
MVIASKEYHVRDLQYVIRTAEVEDSQALADVRLQVDGETENMDRVRGEAYLDAEALKGIIEKDSQSARSLFLVAEVNGEIAGFSRCEGSELKRMAHKVEFGVGVLEAYWGYGIGKHLLKESIQWAEETGVKKMTLNVLETNKKAIKLYHTYGFEIEGMLRKDKVLSDGQFYNTLLMGRFSE